MANIETHIYIFVEPQLLEKCAAHLELNSRYVTQSESENVINIMKGKSLQRPGQIYKEKQTFD